MDDPSLSGILVIDKPADITSHGVVSRLRKVLGTKKIGHAGTLDPMATGILILGVNRATRLLGHLALHDKSYEATIRFGVTTLTDDAEGDVLEVIPAGQLQECEIAAALQNYLGKIQQVPSAVSAIKIAGKRAYSLVRAGEDVVLPSREVEITALKLLAIRNDVDFTDVDIELSCSSGTYVRALARDLGKDLGVGAHLTKLRRSRIGNFDLSWAIDLPEIGEQPKLIDMGQVAKMSFSVQELSDEQAVEVRYGRPLPVQLTANPTAFLHNNELLALYEPTENGSKPLVVFVDGSK